MLRDGTKVATRTLTNGVTTYSFDNLNKYDLTDGHIYEYTTSEEPVEGYTTEKNGNDYTNTINQDNSTVIGGTKTWIAPKDIQHPNITINLLRDGQKVDSRTLKNGTESYKFTNLDKYASDGHIYKYTTSEEPVEGYTSRKDGNNYINTINQEKISVNGNKTWIDPTGTTHPDVTINLLRDGTKVATRTLTNGVTTYSFDNLDKYDLTDGHIYEYTTSEDPLEGYTSVKNGNNYTNTINQKIISISGSKTWIDPKGNIHPDITINLLKDGKEIKEVKLANGVTTYSFENLEKYDLKDGHEFKYTITEDSVKGYTSKIDSYDVINTINQEKVSIDGTKTWIEPSGIENPDITINLLKDGQKVDSRILKNGETKYSFNDLDKYDLTDGHVYKYTVSEDKVNGYTTKQEGNNFTNTIEQDTSVKIEGKKTWIDPEGTVHPDITINLLRDGEKVDSRT